MVNNGQWYGILEIIRINWYPTGCHMKKFMEIPELAIKVWETKIEPNGGKNAISMTGRVSKIDW